ncbi:MAG: hypothetical protein AAF417_09205 [Pseudomonadota bacterium]
MPNDLAQHLEDIRQKRGYLLPHHGLMAVSMPQILAAYDALYTELTLTDRVLTKHQHEFAWMAILIACKEALGTHHVRRYFDAGGTNDELEALSALVAYVAGGSSHSFMGEHWQPHLPDFAPRERYLTSFAKLASDVPLWLAHISAAAICTCFGDWERLRWHIVASYESDAAENALAEALSLTMFPGGVPNFVDATGVWRDVVSAGEVNASPNYRVWAEMTGQGGFDEASGVGPGTAT